MFKNIDQDALIKAAALVVAFGLVVLALTYVIPVLGVLIAVGLVALVIYALYIIFKGKP